MSGGRGPRKHSWPSPARVGFGASQASDRGGAGQEAWCHLGGGVGVEVGADPACHLPLAALGTLEFTLLFDADNSALHCTAHRAKVRMGAGVYGPRAWATGLPHAHCLFSGSQATGLGLCGHVCQSQSAARGQQGEGEPRPLLMPLGSTPAQNTRLTLPCRSPPKPGHQARSSPLLGCATGGLSGRWARVGSRGPRRP